MIVPRLRRCAGVVLQFNGIGFASLQSDCTTILSRRLVFPIIHKLNIVNPKPDTVVSVGIDGVSLTIGRCIIYRPADAEIIYRYTWSWAVLPQLKFISESMRSRMGVPDKSILL